MNYRLFAMSKKQKLVTLSTRVDPKVRSAFEEIAKRQGKNICILLREIVNSYLALITFTDMAKQKTEQVETKNKKIEG